MRISPADVVARALAAEANGFGGIALMDHLAPPLAEAQTMWEAMTLATWVAAHTERLVIGHLVLCDAFRHPAQLAREALTIDHASGGRFELGLGSGSVPAEFRRFGFDTGNAAARLERLAETLEVLRLLWTGEVVEHPGPRFPLAGAQQLPVPTVGRVPLTLGGTAPRLLELASEYADWWSLPPGQLHRLEELRPIAGDRVNVSVLEMYTLLPASGADEVESTARRRFGHLGGTHVIADATTIRRHLDELSDRGVERVYTWFSNFADPAGLEAFGNDVIAAVAD
jgi:alkanesulfonate monooxygenase SsuD/methylene tetrahydromethanopterin reductase-like flavin-dependent oxidoreductase (luciferase family)